MIVRPKSRSKSIKKSPSERTRMVSPMADLSQAKSYKSVRKGTSLGSDTRRHHPRQLFPPPPAPTVETGIPDQPLVSSPSPSAGASGIIASDNSAILSTPGTVSTAGASSLASLTSIMTTSRRVVTVSASPFRLASSAANLLTSTPTQSTKPTQLVQQPQFIVGVACGGAALLGILLGLLVCYVRCRRGGRRRKYSISAPVPWNQRQNGGHAEKGILEDSSSNASPGYGHQETYRNLTESFRSFDSIDSETKLGPLQITNLTPGDKSVGSSRASSVLEMPIGNNEPGTPRELVPGGRPRFLGVSGRGLSWAGQPGPPLAPQQGIAGSWPRLPTPSPYGAFSTRPPVQEAWTTNLRRNLSSAFSSLKGWHSTAENGSDSVETYLTPMPVRQFTGRYPDTSLRTPQGPLSDDYLLGTSLMGPASKSHDVAMPSRPVPFVIPARSFPGADVDRHIVQNAQVPFIAATKPCRIARMRSDSSSRISYYQGQHRGKIGNNEILSSASSMYSQSSAPSFYCQPHEGASSQDKPTVSRQSSSSQETVRRKPGLSTVEEDVQTPSSERPTVISRTSSSGCSVNSYYFSSNSSVSTITGGNGTIDMDRTAHSALIDRRRRARKVI